VTSLRDTAAASSHRDGDDGFTLIELVITIGLVAFIFAAVAAVLTGSLKALAVQKARTQGNEVATQAIEDLQRRSFDTLVLCAPPSGTAPGGLDDWVKGPGCPADTTGYGEDSCNGVNPGQGPKSEYTCTRINVAFNVKRYIAWTDDGHNSKRLAVFVKWTDTVGTHTVSQQSSLRAPTAASIIGLSNPTLSTSGVVPVSPSTNLIDSSGKLTGQLDLKVNATSLSSTDRVFATFWVRDTDGTLLIESVPMTSTDGVLWQASIPANAPYVFAYGSQFFTFNAVRAKDGKSSAVISSAAKFCTPSDTTCSASALPKFTTSVTVPSSVTLTASGGQSADFTVSAETQNVSPTGRAQVLLPTLGGVQAVSMSPATGCTYSSCTWSVVIKKTAGYAYNAGANQVVGFAAYQPYVAGSTTDMGSTASTFKTVTFG
jgi:prepilin-type N-terminal cleavage/methylation domain-containing protein